MNYSEKNLVYKCRKVLRYIRIYGLKRTVVKILGQKHKEMRYTTLPVIENKAKQVGNVGIIGCGMFSYSNIAFFLKKKHGNIIQGAMDIDLNKAASLYNKYGLKYFTDCSEKLLSDPAINLVYIASNHASHADYAVDGIRAGLSVYIEKPISVTRDQLIAVLNAMRCSQSRVFAGYNRPFSPAIRILRRKIQIVENDGFSIQCFVTGHKLAPDHWYRNQDEGTRICGNIGHWLDLAVHLLSWRGMPDILQITVNIADDRNPDDNIIVNFSSDRGDIFSVMMTSRSEPFEGINEMICIQHADTICKIDDFRRLLIWQGERFMKKRFWPKDVGHELAILQPYQNEVKRDWHEVVLSTILMLHITGMVNNGLSASVFSFRETLDGINKVIGQK